MHLMQLAVLAAIVQLSQNPTGTIDGIVTQSGTSFPIAGVQIKAMIPSSRSVFGETVSDGAGVFVFREVPPGPYLIEISKENYVFGALPAFNATATMRIVLNPAQRLQLPVSGIRAAAIRGRVLDAEGRGLPDMPIDILQSTKNAQGQLLWRGIVGPGIRTNDEGEYEKLMLGPGQYVVRTSLERPDTPKTWVYSPGTNDANAAAFVDLREGSEITADIRAGATVDAGSYKISGKVSSTESETARIALVLRRRPADSDPLFALEGSPRTFTDADGNTRKYEFRGVRPGIYDLYALASIDASDYLSKTVLEVRNVDLEDVDLVLQPPMDIKGRLVIDGNPRDLQFRGSSLPNEERDSNRSHIGDVSISLRRIDGLLSDILAKPEISDDGISFSFHHISVGDYDLAISFVPDGRPPSPDLYVADIRAGGRSVVNSGFQVGIDAVDALEVIVGTEGGSVIGTVFGRPLNASGLLVIVPATIREWGTTFYNAVPIAMNGNDQFEFRGLRPGSYRIFVVQANGDFILPANTVPGGPPMQISLRPEFFTQNEAGAVNVTVQRGSTTAGVRVRFPSAR